MSAPIGVDRLTPRKLPASLPEFNRYPWIQQILDRFPGELEKRALPIVSMGERCTMITTCEVIYGCKRGAELSAFLETAMGQPCPCKRGIPCPLMPRQRLAVVDNNEPITELTA